MNTSVQVMTAEVRGRRGVVASAAGMLITCVLENSVSQQALRAALAGHCQSGWVTSSAASTGSQRDIVVLKATEYSISTRSTTVTSSSFMLVSSDDNVETHEGLLEAEDELKQVQGQIELVGTRLTRIIASSSLDLEVMFSNVVCFNGVV